MQRSIPLVVTLALLGGLASEHATSGGREVTDAAPARSAGLKIGDVFEKIDGETVDALIDAWLPYYAASNRTTQLRDIASTMTRGDCGSVDVVIDRRGKSRRRTLEYLSNTRPEPPYHDRPGPTFELLSPEIAYLKLSSVRASDVAGYLDQAKDTRGLVIDIRNCRLATTP